MINCPVCGYDQLTEPLRWSFCPSCGTEFGYSDRRRSHDVLRAAWINSGAEWDSVVIPKPPYWNQVEQLLNIGYVATDEDLAAIARHEAMNVGSMKLPAPQATSATSIGTAPQDQHSQPILRSRNVLRRIDAIFQSAIPDPIALRFNDAPLTNLRAVPTSNY